MKSLRVFAVLFLAACSADLPHSAPFDEKSPAEKQARAQLRGKVVLENESDFSQVAVRLQNADRTYTVESLADGSIDLTGIVPGDYTLTVGTRYFEQTEQAVRFTMGETLDFGQRELRAKREQVTGSALIQNAQGDTDGRVVVTLKRAASLRGGAQTAPSSTGPAGLVAQAESAGGIEYSVTSGDDGSFTIDDVPAGVYDVTAEQPGVAIGTFKQVSVTGEDGVVKLVPMILEPMFGSLHILGKVAGMVTSSTVALDLDATGSPQSVQLAFDPGFVTALPILGMTPNTTVDLPAGDGLRSIYARYYDIDGNVSSVAFDSVEVDSTAPKFPSFTIVESSPTRSATLHLTLSATGADDMAVSENACSANWEPYAPAKALDLASTVDGPRTIAVQFKDAAGNTTACQTRDIEYDGTPPQPLANPFLVHFGSAMTTSNVVVLNFNAAGAQEVRVSEDVSFADTNWVPYTPTRTFTLSPGNGTKTVHAQFRDRADNQSAALFDTIVLDTTPIGTPFVTLQADVTSSTTVNLTLAASNTDEMMLSHASDFAVNSGWISYQGTYSYTFPAGDGVKTIYVKFRKLSGAESAVVTDTYILDTANPILPSIRINDGATVAGNTLVTLNLAAVDETSGLAVYRLNTSNAFAGIPARAFQTNDVYTLTAGDGLKTLWVTYGDRAGNYSSAASVAVVLDSAAPVVNSVAVTRLDGSAIGNGVTVKDGRIMLASDVTDLTPLEMQVTTNGSYAGLGWESFNASKVIDLTAATSTLAVRVRDGAGHVTGLLSGFIVHLDSAAPVLTLTLNSVSPTNLLDVELGLSATESSEYQVSDNPGFANAAWSPAGTQVFSLAPGDGLRTLYARAKDAAGNLSELKTVTVGIDQTPPQNAAFTIAAGLLTNNRALSLAYSGVEIDNVRVSEDTCSGAYATHGGGGSFNLASTGDGLKTVAVQFQDNVGNATACLTRMITLDTTLPVVGFVRINNDAAHTTSRTVSVAISVTGATEMQLSESPGFSGAGWQPVTTSVNFTLSAGEGGKTVHARFRDAANNIVPGGSKTITVDTIAPVFTSLTGPAATPLPGVTLNLVAATAAEMRLSENADFGGASWTAYDAAPAFTLVNTQGAHTIYVQLRDVAHNESLVRTVAIALDSAAPGTPLVSIVGGAHTKLAGITVQTVADDAAQMLISQYAAMTDATWVAYSQLKSFTLVGGEGARTVYIKVRDAAGNESGVAVASVTLDQTAPTVYMRADDGQGNLVTQTNNTRYYMSVTVTDATAVQAQFNSSNSWAGIAAESVAALRTWDVVAPIAAGGAGYTTYIRVSDAAGNVTVAGPVTVLVDTIAPGGATLALSPGLVSSTTVDVALFANNADFVEVSEDISFLAPTIFPYTTTSNHVFMAGDGTKTLYARYGDLLGNYSPIVAASTLLDTTPPENPAFAIAQANPTRQTSLDLTLSANGASQMAISENGCAANWESYTQNKVFLLSTSPDLEVDKTISVRYRDTVNNATACVTKTIRFDNFAPQIASAFQVNYGAPSTSNGIVTLNVQVTGAHEMQVSENNSFSEAAWLPYSDTRTFILSAGNGAKTVYARFRDQADNRTATVSDGIVLDTTPISTPFVTIQADATSSTTVNISLAASNIDEMSLSHLSDFSTGSGWISYQGTYAYAFPAGDGEKTIYAKFRKSSGAESVVASDTYLLDTTPPILPGIRVNNGVSVVDTNVVTLNLSAVDAVSGLSVYRINATNDFAAAPDRAYQVNAVYSLPALDGAHALWVLYGDRAGNFSAPASTTVFLDRAAPVLTSAGLTRLDGTPIASNDTVNEGRILLSSVVSDLTALEIQLTTNGSYAGGAWVPYSAVKVIDLVASSSTISARVRDAAGHVTDILSSVVVNLDTAPPTGNSLSINGGASWANDRNATLTLGSTGAVEMRISENSDYSGAAWLPYATSQAFELSVGDGAKVIYVTYRDTAGNESPSVSKLIQLDTAAPGGVGLSLNSGAAYATNVNVSLSISGVEASQMQISENATFTGATWTAFTTVYSHAITGGQGLRTVYLRLRDVAGNISPTASDTITLDTVVPTAPLIAITQKPSTANTVVSLTLSASGATQMMLGDDAGFTGRTWQAYTTSASWVLPAGDGLKSVFAMFRDEAGNASSAVFDQTTLDQQGPTLQNPPVQINTGAAYVKSESVNITVRYVDAVSAAVGEDIAVAFPITTTVLPGGGVKTFPAVLSPNEGTKNIYVKFYDAAGNSIVQGTSVTLDKTAPTAGLVSIDAGAAYNRSAAGSATLSLSAQDAGSGISQVRISNTNANANLDGAVAVAFAPSVAWTLASPGAGVEGIRDVHVKFIDAAGNESAAVYSDTIGYDTQAPQPSLFRIGSSEFTTTLSNSLQIDATGATEMKISADSLFNGAAYEPFATARMWTFGNGGDGVLQTLHIKFRDAAGNESTFASDSISVDNQAPSGLAMILDGGAEYGGAPQPNYTRDAELLISLSASNWTVAEVSDDVGFQNIIASFGAADLFPQSIVLPAANQTDGLKTIYTRFKDAAGNASTLISRTIMLDTSKPTPASVVINGGAAFTNVQTGIVTLALAAGDSGSGVGNMRIAHTPVDLASATDEPFNGSKLWTLTDPGAGKEYMAEVYYQVADKAGNWTDPVMDQIAYDTLAPVLGPTPIVFPGAQPSRFRLQNVSLQVAGATEMLLGNDNSFTARTWEPFAFERQWTFPGGGDDVAYSLFVTFRDAAGNQTAIIDESFSIDDVAPSAPALTLSGGFEYGGAQNTDYSRDTEYYLSASATNWDHVELAYDPAFGYTFDTVANGTSMPMQRYLPIYEGNAVVYGRFYDTAGNVSTVAYDSITVDSSPPYLTSIYLNGHDLLVNPWMEGPWAVTTETGVYTLSIGASDYGTGVTQEIVDETVSGGGQTVLSFQPQPKTLTLSNPGPNLSQTRMLDVVVRDAAGNEGRHAISFQYMTVKPSIQAPRFVNATGQNVFMLNSLDTLVKFTNAWDVTAYQLSNEPYFSGAVWTSRPGDPYCPNCFGSDFTVPFSLSAVAPTWMPGMGIPPPPTPPAVGQPEQRMVFVRIRNAFGLVSNLSQVDPNPIMLDTIAPLSPTISLNNYFLTTPSIAFNYTIRDMTPNNDYARLEADTDSRFDPQSPYDPSTTMNPQMYGINTWMIPYSATDLLNMPWSLQDGAATLYFRTVDMAGNSSVAVAAAVTIDTMPPQIASVIANGGAMVTKSPLLSLVINATDPANYMNGGAASGLDRIGVLQNQWDSCQNAVYNLGNGVPFAASTSITPSWVVADGMYTVYFCVTDRARNASSSGLGFSYSFFLDTAAPNGLIFQPAFPGTTTGSVNVTVRATSSNFDPVEVQLSNEPLFIGAVWQPAGMSIPWLLTAGDGAKTVYAKFRDQAGNESAVQTTSITLDTTPPQAGSLVVNAGAPVTSSTTLQFTLSAAESLSMPMQMQFGSDPGFSGTSWLAYTTSGSVTIPIGDGFRTLYVRFRDSLGNVSPASSASFTLDQTGPLLSYLLINNGQPYAGNSVPINLQIGNWTTGDRIQVASAADFTDSTVYAATAGANNLSFALGGAQGASTLYVRGLDALGNIGTVYSAALTKDTVVPAITLFRAEDGATNVIASTRQLTYTLRLTASDSAPVTVQYSATNSFSGVPAEAFTATRQWSVTPPVTPTGENRLAYVRVSDAAGNAVTQGPVTVLVDTMGPSSVNLTTPAVSSNSTVTANLSALFGDWVELSGDISFLAPTVFSMRAATSYTFSNGDGLKYLYARYADTVGNYSEIVSSVTLIDTQAPTGADFTILEGATTPLLTVHLTLTAAGASQMQISEGGCVGSWVAYSTNASYDFQSNFDGVKSISVRFKDDVGNLTGCITKNITFDSTAPYITSVSPRTGAGNRLVIINGINFGAAGTVTIAGIEATQNSWTNSDVKVLVPASAPPVSTQLVLTTGGKSYATGFNVLPGITKVTPNRGWVGDSITLTGTGFGPAGQLYIGGILAATTGWYNNVITATVPASAPAGQHLVEVVSNSLASQSLAYFTVKPKITGVTPASGATGVSVTINGAQFGTPQGTNSVIVGGQAATVTSWGAASIVATIPTGLIPGDHAVQVRVTTTDSNPVTYTVSRPWIMARTPNHGIQGDTITVTGRNFGAATGTATIGGISATVTAWYNSAITLTVPAGLTSGARDLRVRNTALVYSNIVPFQYRGSDSWFSNGDRLRERSGHSAVYTGSEMIVFGGYLSGTYFNDGARYNPTTDSWIALPALNAPSARNSHSAVWTGKEMIVWGGYDGAAYLDTGARYDPMTNAWTATALAGAPSPRVTGAVWTGSKMIVWGGYDSIGRFATGGVYNPTTNLWTGTSTGANALSARRGSAMVWSGKEMLVWGGSDGAASYSNGARYNPAGDTWTAMSSSPLAARSNSHAAWSGSEMIVWGGGDITPINNGALYNPASDTWVIMGSGGFGFSSVWTGTHLILWGSSSCCTTYSNSGTRYSPETNTWTSMSTTGAPTGRVSNTLVWTGTEVLVWGGTGAGNTYGTGGRYNPLTDTWGAKFNGGLYANTYSSLTWTGSEFLMAGTLERYDPATDRVRAMNSSGSGSKTSMGVVWTGTKMIVWGGYVYNSCCGTYSYYNSGGQYSPATDSWTATSTGANVPTARYGPRAVWDSAHGQMIIQGGSNAGSPSTGGRYDPLTDSWTATNPTGATASKTGESMVWTGSVMIVFGGKVGIVYKSGAQYDPNPAGDSWTAIPDAYVARYSHAAVWTGSKMLVYGGYYASGGTAASYNSIIAFDGASWSTLSSAGAPSARGEMSSVWTGTEFVVWGGNYYNDDGVTTTNTLLQGGGRFDPTSGTWSGISSTGEPAAAKGIKGTWAGNEMFLFNQNSVYRYTP